MKSRLGVWAVYLVGCGLVSFVALEIALRLYLQMPVFTLRDWRGQRAGLLQTSGAVYDPLLGWSQRSNFVSGGFDTLDYGIRKNSDEDEQLTPGSVLAVGDSYTAGSEVVNEDTWPAQLERALGIRVIMPASADTAWTRPFSMPNACCRSSSHLLSSSGFTKKTSIG